MNQPLENNNNTLYNLIMPGLFYIPKIWMLPLYKTAEQLLADKVLRGQTFSSVLPPPLI